MCTILFGLIVMVTTLQMLWGSISVLLEGVPENIDAVALREQFLAIRGNHGEALASNVHDLHGKSARTNSASSNLARSLCVYKR